MRVISSGVLALAVVAAGPARADDAGARVRADARAGKPLVVHVVVALCDNVHQGIVPVPPHLGRGDDPGGNLYWGARYGVRGYLDRAAGWKRVSLENQPAPGVLERAVYSAQLKGARAYLVAEAWDGSRIRDAIARFLEMAAGRQPETLRVAGEAVAAGGQSHVVAFIGHNGLMDFEAPRVDAGPPTPARAAIVLACASRPYFADLLQRAGASPLVLTTGLMAPEAYALEAAVRAWLEGGDAAAARTAAADAYDRYQKCGRRAARRLFAAPAGPGS